MAQAITLHTLFDLLALLTALAGGVLVYRWRLREPLEKTTAKLDIYYLVFLSTGSVLGAYLFGTLNIHLSGEAGAGKSILGALFGATFMVEAYKLRRGQVSSTGYIYVIPFTLCVMVGRLGCFLSGTMDFTHGIETAMPWGWDYGDGVIRHPVQLYESFSMFVFFGVSLILLARFKSFFVRYGYYLCVGFYAAQRFAWEFFKPYGDVALHLNLFQLLCLCLILYSFAMIVRVKNAS